MAKDKHGLHGNAIDLTGKRFDRLVVVEIAGRVRGQVAWRCRCDCGNPTVVPGHDLRSGNTSSCGCYQAECRADAGLRNKTHGRSHTTEYNIWAGIKQRCHDQNHRYYEDYGGRGIVVCRRWRANFAAFLADMGLRPAGLTIDRRDNDGHYSCGRCQECVANGWSANCRWATRTQQARNRRSNRLITHNGETVPLAVWAERTGIGQSTLHYRIRVGWSVQRALTTPV